MSTPNTNGIITNVVNTGVRDVKVSYFVDDSVDHNIDLPIDEGYSEYRQMIDSSYIYIMNAVSGDTIRMHINFNYSVDSAGIKKILVDKFEILNIEPSVYAGATIEFTAPDISYALGDLLSIEGVFNTSYGTDKSYVYMKIDSSRIDSLETQVSTLTNELNDANATISSLNTQINTANSNISQLNTDLNDANSHITTLNTDIDTLNGQITTLTKEIDDANTKIGFLEGDKLNLQGNLDNSNIIIAELKNELASDTLSMTQMSESIAKYQEDAVIKDKNITDLTNSNIDLQNQITLLNSKILELETAATNDILTITSLQNQIKTLNNDNTYAKDTINTLTNEVTTLNNTITNLNNQITNLKSQISSGASNNQELLDNLNLAQEELKTLEQEYITRLQQVEQKLSNTTDISTTNSEALDELKKSLMADILANINNPRFGFIPLSIAKQAMAETRELLSDPNTGHIYIKSKDGLLSKTKNNENRLDVIDKYIDSSWVAISVDYSNYEDFKSNEDTSLFINSDNTLSSSTNIVNLQKVNIRYNSMCEYLVGVKFTHGNVNSVVFIDKDHNQYPTVLINKSSDTALFKLTGVVPNVEIHPSVILGNNTTIKNILVYKDVDISIKKTNLTSLDLSSDISMITGDFNPLNNLFTINSTKTIRIDIGSNTLREGLYNLSLRTLNNLSAGLINVKFVGNGTIMHSIDIDLSKVTSIAGSKIFFSAIEIPKLTTSNNYILITTSNIADIIIEYILLDMISFNINNYYNIGQIDTKINALADVTTKFISDVNDRPRFWNGSAPPVAAKVGDYWGDENNNVIKKKLDTTTWRIIGAKYN